MRLLFVAQQLWVTMGYTTDELLTFYGGYSQAVCDWGPRLRVSRISGQASTATLSLTNVGANKIFIFVYR
ncbi:MAG: hypothetical protein M1357_03210 [Candidatus Marsarchaeota archaeon]|nr:hypothetical protein [Candidatus Marsarchaeota archaeon]